MSVYITDKDGKLVKVSGSNASFTLPIGSIFSSAIPIMDANVHLLDGSLISQTGLYKTFADLIKSLVSAGNNIIYEDDENSTAEQKFNADVSATGNCGKFIIDDKNGTIRLPKITTFIQGLTNLTNIGSSLSAGLPNITGDFKTRTNVVKESTGLFNLSSQSVTGDWSQANLTIDGYNLDKIDFNASNSNSIYGNSTTVQPNATQYPYYIVLAAGYKSSSQVNIDNYVTELNGKLAKAEIKRYPIETYNDGNTKYTIYNDGFKTCSGIMWTNQSVSSSNELNITLTLPVEFSGNYIVVYNGSNYIISLGSWNHSTQSCLLRFGGYQGGRTLSRVDWYVEGY